MVTRGQIEVGIAKYLDSEFMSQIHTEQWKQFALATGTSIAIKRLGKVVDELKNNKAMVGLGIIDENGNVDIDIIAEEAKSKLPSDGLKIDIPLVGNVTIHESDIDLLYRDIVGGV